MLVEHDVSEIGEDWAIFLLNLLGDCVVSKHGFEPKARHTILGVLEVLDVAGRHVDGSERVRVV